MGYQGGAWPARLTLRSNQSMSAMAPASIIRDLRSGKKSELHAANEGRTLTISVFLNLELPDSLLDIIAIPQWIPPRNDKIIAP